MNEHTFFGSAYSPRREPFVWVQFAAMCAELPVGRRGAFCSMNRYITATKTGDGRLSFTSRPFADLEDEQQRPRGEIARLLKIWGVEDQVSASSFRPLLNRNTSQWLRHLKCRRLRWIAFPSCRHVASRSRSCAAALKTRIAVASPALPISFDKKN